MTKTYVEELAEWTRKRKSGRDKHLVAFRSVESDVKEALDAGFSVKTIWCNLHEIKKITCGYETFLNLVNRHIRGKQLAKSLPPTLSRSTRAVQEKNMKAALQSGKASSPSLKLADTPGFIWNSVPNKDELL
jgi:hypothetical protein